MSHVYSRVSNRDKVLPNVCHMFVVEPSIILLYIGPSKIVTIHVQYNLELIKEHVLRLASTFRLISSLVPRLSINCGGGKGSLVSIACACANRPGVSDWNQALFPTPVAQRVGSFKYVHNYYTKKTSISFLPTNQVFWWCDGAFFSGPWRGPH